MEQETVTFRLPMIQADVLSCILYGLGRMFRSMPAAKLGMTAVKLGIVVRPDTISLGVFMGERRMSFLSLCGCGVGVSQPIILTRMMDFDDLDFVHSFSRAVNEGRFLRSLELCASRVLPEGPPRLDMFGETTVVTIPTDFQLAKFFKKNKPLPRLRVGIADNTMLNGINSLLSHFRSETGTQLAVIVNPVNGILFRIRRNRFGLAALKYHLPQSRGERQKLLTTREMYPCTIPARC